MRFLLLALALPLHASVVGTSKPAESLSVERIKQVLPAAEQQPWLDYLRRSTAQLRFDQDEPFIERSHLTVIPPMPKEGGTRSMPLGRDASFYKSPEAFHIAETILSFQIPNGGWSKNLDMSGPPRLPGQSYTPNNISRYLGPDDFDKPANPNWNYVGTIDNDATYTEIEFLARVSTAYPGPDGDRFRKSILRGVYYLLNAQYPNGGWPQVWPLEGGYHDAITFNDNAVTNSTTVLQQAASGEGDFAFVPSDVRAKASSGAQRALACILRAQLRVNGKLTVWAQQNDPLTFAPVSGRNYEPASLSAGESADLLVFLMRQPHPDAAMRASIEAGVDWLKQHAIYGQAWVGGGFRRTEGGPPPNPRHLEASPGAGPIWPRYTSLTTDKPIFGDRDKSIHDTVDDLSLERRNGYSWYSAGPKAALDAYTVWKAKAGA